MRFSLGIVLPALLLGLQSTETVAFLSTRPFATSHYGSFPITTTTTATTTEIKTHLFAKKETKKSTGAGFGSTPAPSKASKIRTVTGYTGSGTKPLRLAANTFDSLRKTHGKECTVDVYVRSPAQSATTFWFAGKVGRRLPADGDEDDVPPTELEAMIAQKRLILEYAKQLRPQNLGGGYGRNLELWFAPGDTEMDVAQNKITLQQVKGTIKDISDTFSVADVGYNPEIYVGDEITDGGLRVQRDEEGKPLKAAFEIGI